MTKRTWAITFVAALMIFTSIFVLVITEEWLPLNAVLFRLSVLPAPEIEGSRFVMVGSEWYPLIDRSDPEKDGTERRSFTYIKINGWSNSYSNLVQFLVIKQGLPERLNNGNEAFPWGIVKYAKTEKIRDVQEKIAWIPSHNLYVTAANDSEMREALKSLTIVEK